jgi:hypothetical protein
VCKVCKSTYTHCEVVVQKLDTHYCCVHSRAMKA